MFSKSAENGFGAASRAVLLTEIPRSCPNQSSIVPHDRSYVNGFRSRISITDGLWGERSKKAKERVSADERDACTRLLTKRFDRTALDPHWPLLKFHVRRSSFSEKTRTIAAPLPHFRAEQWDGHHRQSDPSG